MTGTYIQALAGRPLGGGGSGVTTVGTINSQTPSSDALVIASDVLYAQTASTSNPGMMSAADKTTVSALSGFTAGSVIFSNGSGLAQDNSQFYWDDTAKALKLKTLTYQLGTLDPFSRSQIWNKDTNSILRLGSWEEDGDPTSVTSEGIVVYGDSLTGQPISNTNGSYARVKNNRFGLYTIDSTLPAYSGGAYYFRADDTAMFYANNSAVNTFSVQRTSGDTVVGSLTASNTTATTVPYLDSAKKLVSSSVTPTELGYVSGVTSGIQTQINSLTNAVSVTRVYVDFVNGNDSTGTGSPTKPWKTIQHASNSTSPTINVPITIYISGGNNDTDTGTITLKPNLNLFAEYPIQIGVPVTVTGGTTNDTATFTNITFVGTFTWSRNDATAIALAFNFCEFFSGPVLAQTGAGTFSIYMNNCVTVNAAFTTGGTGCFFTGCSLLGTTTFADVTSAAYFEILGGYVGGAVSVSGAPTVYLSGVAFDTPFGASLTAVTTGNGSPTFQSDSGSIPPSITGTPTLNLVSYAQHESYTPAVSGNWSVAPTQVAAALDDLAAASSANYDYFTPLTGTSVTVTGIETFINPAGTLATLTINLPATPVKGQKVKIMFSQIVTSLTLGFGAKSHIGTPVTTAAVGTVINYIYESTTSTWYPA